MRIIAHRGSSHSAPENTLAAFRLAWDEGADGVEFDVRLTRDRKIAVIHDETARRTSGRAAKISDLTLREVQSLDAGSWKGPEWKGERVPELSETLALTPPGKLVMVEIKCGGEILPELRRVTAESRLAPKQLLFLCFSLDVLSQTKRSFPDHLAIQNVVLARRSLRRTWSPSSDALVKRARAAGIDGFGVGFCRGINAEFVRKIRDSGLKLFVWTVDNVAAARRMRDMGVDYLATNRPAWLRADIA